MRGDLRVWQPKKGYRFTLDPLLLVDFVASIAANTLCDLCAGVGIICLAALKMRPTTHGVAVELQPRLAQLATRNVAENDLADRMRVVELDLADENAARAALPGAQFDLVLANPPYRVVGHGPTNPRDEAAIARHELRLTMPALIKQARRIVKPEGHVALIYPPDRLPALLHALSVERLQPIVLRLVHAKADEPAYLALVLAQKGGKTPLSVRPPLNVYEADGTYTSAVRGIFDR